MYLGGLLFVRVWVVQSTVTLLYHFCLRTVIRAKGDERKRKEGQKTLDVMVRLPEEETELTYIPYCPVSPDPSPSSRTSELPQHFDH